MSSSLHPVCMHVHTHAHPPTPYTGTYPPTGHTHTHTRTHYLYTLHTHTLYIHTLYTHTLYTQPQCLGPSSLKLKGRPTRTGQEVDVRCPDDLPGGFLPQENTTHHSRMTFPKACLEEPTLTRKSDGTGPARNLKFPSRQTVLRGLISTNALPALGLPASPRCSLWNGPDPLY